MKIHSNCTFGSDDRAKLKSKFLKQKYDRLCVPDNPVWIQTLFLTKKRVTMKRMMEMTTSNTTKSSSNNTITTKIKNKRQSWENNVVLKEKTGLGSENMIL